MTMDPIAELLSLRFTDESTGIGVDLADMGVRRDELDEFAGPMHAAFSDMEKLERGQIVNRDEDRRVGHYWLRAPELAPQGIGDEIRECVERLTGFARRVLEAELAPTHGGRFTHVCLIGIGGSALGPELLVDALQVPGKGLKFASLDNTDPDGIHRTLSQLPLATTLFLVISKSGGTKETRNGMLEAKAACESDGVTFARQAVAITMPNSHLDELATSEDWLARFPIWDWVGGRTSISSAVGLVPAALCGIDTEAFLAGMSAMDAATRPMAFDDNLAAWLAAGWHLATGGHARRAMVVLPYRDRLGMLGRYLQQLVMESLGKRLDRNGRIVHHGITVYGNKGSTDQHAYVQQLREGPDDFFVSFIRVLDDGTASGLEVDPDVTSGDYLQGFYIGTRQALSESGHPNLTLTVPKLDAASLGALIALFERAVGLYASLVDINAYHQPGVEAGKRAAGEALALQARVREALGSSPISLEDLVAKLDCDPTTCLLLLEHLAANSKAELSDGGWSRSAK